MYDGGVSKLGNDTIYNHSGETGEKVSICFGCAQSCNSTTRLETSFRTGSDVIYSNKNV